VGGYHYLVQRCAWGKQGAMELPPLPMAMNGVPLQHFSKKEAY